MNKYRCPYCPYWDEDSTPVIVHIMAYHKGLKVPVPSDMQVSS